MPIAPRPETWIRPTAAGLYCEPGDFHIDPSRPAPRAVISHGHGDHARAGNGHVLTTPQTAAIMQMRYGEGAGVTMQTLPYDQGLTIGAVRI
ncbi:MAG: DNA ligase-associated DEXH box helicase, partial [Stellaceae bacterium]